MLSRLLPRPVTNTYLGFGLAKYGFFLLTLMVLVRSCIHIFAPDGGAQTIATIPLDAYSIEARQTVVGMFAYWGLSQLLVGLLFLIVAIRYKSLIPLMFAIMTCEQIGRIAIGMMKPIETVSTAPGSAANLPLLVFSVVMLCLSLWPRNV